MFKDLNIFEKAGLIIGGIECVAGFALAMYAHIKYKEEAKKIMECKEQIAQRSKEIDEFLKDTGLTED